MVYIKVFWIDNIDNNCYISMLSSCDMIKEYNLSIFFTINFNPLSTITRWILVWININYFSISLISKQKACIWISINSKVWWIIKLWKLRVPIEMAQICCLWHEIFLSFKNLSEVFCFKSMSQINVTWDLTSSFSWISNENDCCHSSASDIIFSLS